MRTTLPCLAMVLLAACPGPVGPGADASSTDRFTVDASPPADASAVDAHSAADAQGADGAQLVDAMPGDSQVAVDSLLPDSASSTDTAPVDGAPPLDAASGDTAGASDAASVDTPAGADGSALDVGGQVDAGSVDAAPPADASGSPDSGSATTTTLRVHYDTGYGNHIAIRGAAAPLSWSSDAAATWSEGNVWIYTTTALGVATEFKPVLVDGDGSITWARGANWVVQPGASLDLYPFFVATAGSLESFSIASTHLGDNRQVEVYLPPSYGEAGAAGREYPLLIMQDGQNLFDPQAFFGGWAVDDALDALLEGDVATGGVLDLIVAAPHNGGTARLYEYTPTAGETEYCTSAGDCGGADAYLDFVVDELLPELRSRYRAAPGRVGIAGSSLGGLVSMHACWSRPQSFDRCGVFSPSLWWDSAWMLGQVAGDLGPRRDLRIYLDAGTVSDGLGNVLALATDLTTKAGDLAYHVDQDLLCLQGAGHEHNELAWRARAPWALEWLYQDPDRVQPAPPRPSEITPCAL